MGEDRAAHCLGTQLPMRPHATDQLIDILMEAVTEELLRARSGAEGSPRRALVSESERSDVAERLVALLRGGEIALFL